MTYSIKRLHWLGLTLGLLTITFFSLPSQPVQANSRLSRVNEFVKSFMPPSVRTKKFAKSNNYVLVKKQKYTRELREVDLEVEAQPSKQLAVEETPGVKSEKTEAMSSNEEGDWMDKQLKGLKVIGRETTATPVIQKKVIAPGTEYWPENMTVKDMRWKMIRANLSYYGSVALLTGIVGAVGFVALPADIFPYGLDGIKNGSLD